MAFTDEDFINILEYCKDMDNFNENSKICYDNIINVSDSLIEDSRFYLFNFDHICENIFTKSNGKPGPHPASTDGLDYIIGSKNNTLFFIEFKNFPVKSVDYKKQLKSIKKSLDEEHCYCQQDFCPITLHSLNSLNNIYENFEDERICQLKIKTTESLFFVMPKLFEYYKKNNPNFEKTLEEFVTWLLKSNKHFIVVFADNNDNIPNRQFSFKNRLENKYKHFRNVANIKTSIVEKTEFENNFMYKHSH